ncbi:hypothetical protein MMC25_007004 [Agyrium rufum]|nr:hypothetical protein [Agyrium rufum]
MHNSNQQTYQTTKPPSLFSRLTHRRAHRPVTTVTTTMTTESTTHPERYHNRHGKVNHHNNHGTTTTAGGLGGTSAATSSHGRLGKRNRRTNVGVVGSAAHGHGHGHGTTMAGTTTTAPHHHQRRPSLGDKVSGAMMKLRGSLTRRPGLKAAGTRRTHGTDGRGSRRI